MQPIQLPQFHKPSDRKVLAAAADGVQPPKSVIALLDAAIEESRSLHRSLPYEQQVALTLIGSYLTQARNKLV